MDRAVCDVGSGVGVYNRISAHCVHACTIGRKRQAVKPKRAVFGRLMMWRRGCEFNGSWDFALGLDGTDIPDFNASIKSICC